MKKNNRLSFVGVTHLSLVYGIVSASKGFKVIFYDNQKDIIEKFDKGIFSIDEPGIKKFFSKYRGSLFFTSDIEEIKKSKIVFIAPDIETDSNGKSNLYKINLLISMVLNHIESKQLLIILSQVQPGFTRIISKKHSLTYYMVETLIFGEAMNRALYPERIIIGKNNKDEKMDHYFLKYLYLFSKKIIEMNYESAELTKISINIFLATSITTTNYLSDIANQVNANWNHIKESLKLDKRIGKYAYLEPGLGISGGNIERDLRSIKDISKKIKINQSLINSVKKYSSYYKDWPFRALNKIKYQNKKIGILGLTYKENTNSIKNSPSIKLINKMINTLKIKKDLIFVFDPKVKFIKNLKVNYLDNELNLLKSCKILIIMTNWDIFKNLKLRDIVKNFDGNDIIDPYETLNIKIRNSKRFNFFSLKKN